MTASNLLLPRIAPTLPAVLLRHLDSRHRESGAAAFSVCRAMTLRIALYDAALPRLHDAGRLIPSRDLLEAELGRNRRECVTLLATWYARLGQPTTAAALLENGIDDLMEEEFGEHLAALAEFIALGLEHGEGAELLAGSSHGRLVALRRLLLAEERLEAGLAADALSVLSLPVPAALTAAAAEIAGRCHRVLSRQDEELRALEACRQALGGSLAKAASASDLDPSWRPRIAALGKRLLELYEIADPQLAVEVHGDLARAKLEPPDAFTPGPTWEHLRVGAGERSIDRLLRARRRPNTLVILEGNGQPTSHSRNPHQKDLAGEFEAALSERLERAQDEQFTVEQAPEPDEHGYRWLVCRAGGGEATAVGLRELGDTFLLEVRPCFVVCGLPTPEWRLRMDTMLASGAGAAMAVIARLAADAAADLAPRAPRPESRRAGHVRKI